MYRPQQDKHRRAANVVAQPQRSNIAPPKPRSMITSSDYFNVSAAPNNYRDKFLISGLRWMMKPRIPRDFLYYFPYGLEYLLNLNRLFIDYGELTARRLLNNSEQQQ